MSNWADQYQKGQEVEWQPPTWLFPNSKWIKATVDHIGIDTQGNNFVYIRTCVDQETYAIKDPLRIRPDPKWIDQYTKGQKIEWLYDSDEKNPQWLSGTIQYINFFDNRSAYIYVNASPYGSFAIVYPTRIRPAKDQQDNTRKSPMNNWTDQYTPGEKIEYRLKNQTTWVKAVVDCIGSDKNHPMVYVWNPIFSYVDIDNQNDIKPLLNQEDQQEETPMEQNKIKSQSSFDSANTQRQKTNKTLITLIENQIIQARLDGLYSVIISQPVISAEVKDYFVSDPLNYKFGYTPEGAIKFFW